MKLDRATATCLRSVLMKPEHREWLPRIWSILEEATNEALGIPQVPLNAVFSVWMSLTRHWQKGV